MGFNISNEKKRSNKKYNFKINRFSFQVNNLITLFCILNKDINFIILPLMKKIL